jgi:hypothetical protein
VLVELTDKARAAGYELMAGPMMTAGELLMERYSERDLELMIDFMERGAEIRENHIAWLRAKLAARATDS